MDDQNGTRARPPLKVKKESLRRLLGPGDLAQVAGGCQWGRKNSRFCVTGDGT